MNGCDVSEGLTATAGRSDGLQLFYHCQLQSPITAAELKGPRVSADIPLHSCCGWGGCLVFGWRWQCWWWWGGGGCSDVDSVGSHCAEIRRCIWCSLRTPLVSGAVDISSSTIKIAERLATGCNPADG